MGLNTEHVVQGRAAVEPTPLAWESRRNELALTSQVLEAPGQEDHIIVVNFSLPMKDKVLALPLAVREQNGCGKEVASRENTGNLKREKRHFPVLIGLCTLLSIECLCLYHNYYVSFQL